MSTKSFTAVFSNASLDIGADGLACVFNNSTQAGTTLNISEIRITPKPRNSDATNLYGNQGIVSLDRISAVSGGTEITAEKYDTSASDLPSQVKCYINPDSVTIGNKIRQFGDCLSSYQITRSISFQGMLRAPGILDANDHSGRTCEAHNIWHVDGEADTESLVLNAGQGICLTRRAFGVPQSFHFAITVRDASTTRVYKYRDDDSGTANEIGAASVAFINGAGSGVTLHVMIVSMPDIGEDFIPSYRIIRCGTQFDSGYAGTAVAIAAHDTSNTFTELSAYKGAFRIRPKSADLGVPVTYHDFQATPITVAVQQTFDNFRRFSGCGPYITETGTVTMAADMLSRSEYEVWPGARRGAEGTFSCCLTLHQGEGVAVVGGGAGLVETSEQAYLDIEIVGYVDSAYPTPAEIAEEVWTRTGRTLTA